MEEIEMDINELNIPKYLNNCLQSADINKINPYLLYYFFLKNVNGENRKKVLQYLKRPFKELSYYRERQNSLIISLKNNNFSVCEFTGKLLENAIPGLGISSAFETGISLNFIYGFPYLPASSLKGITSDYAIFYEGKDKEKDEDYKNVFGAQGLEGNVIFFDALPIIDNNILDLDVMTPHFQEYYSNNSFPGDYLKPNPILFLVIKKNVSFKFYLASKDKNLLNIACKWLKGALENIGIGGKTSVGYGHFSIK